MTTISKTLSLNDQFTRVMNEAEKATSRMLETADKLDSALSKAGQSEPMAKLTNGIQAAGKPIAAIGAGLTAMGFSAQKSYGEFEAAINKAAVIGGSSAGSLKRDMADLSMVANKMGKDLPISATDAAQAMITMAQNGANVKTLQEIFPAVAQASTAAGADLVDTAGTIQQAMNIWGDSLESPQQAAAILVKNANLSNASVESMQQGMANVASSSRLLGVDMNTASMSIGLLTNTGMSAAQASQNLNHALLKMASPSKNGAKLMGRLGLSYTDAAGNMKPFKEILTEVNDKVKGMSQADKTSTLKGLFDTSGMQAISPLLDAIENKTNDTSVSWEAYEKAMAKASGTAAASVKYLADSANDMQQNVGSKIEQLGGAWEAFTFTAMQGTSGFTSGLLQSGSDILTWATESDSGLAKMARSFMGLTPVIGPVLTSVGGAMMSINHIVKGVSSAFTGLKFIMTNPFALAIVAIAALVAGLVYAYKHSETFRNKVNQAVDGVKNKFNELKTAAQPALNSIKQAFSKLNMGDTLKLGAQLGALFMAYKKFQSLKLNNPLSKMSFAMPKMANPFGGLAAKAKSTGAAVKSAFTGIGNAIASSFKGIGTGISTALQGAAKAISSLTPAGMLGFAMGVATVTAALVALSAARGMVLPFLQGLSNILVSLVGGVLQGFATALVSAAPALVTLAEAMARLSPLVIAVGQAFAAAAPLVVAIGQAFATVITSLSPVITALGSAIAGIITAMMPLTPIVDILAQSFVKVVGILSGAVVKIIEVLAPFIPHLTQMVQAIAPVLAEMVGAFTTLITQISPILDSLSGVITAFGGAIGTALSGVAQVFVSTGMAIATAASGIGQGLQSALNGAAAVVTAFGSAIHAALSGLADLFVSAGAAIAMAASGIGQGLQSALNGIADVILATGASAKAALDGLANAFKSAGEGIGSAARGIGDGIKSAFDGIASVIESVGSSIRSVLDGIAGIFESMGDAALKAGKGVDLISHAVSRLTALNAGDMANTLYKLADGLTKIGQTGSSLGPVGDAMVQLGAGMARFASSAMVGIVSINQIAGAAARLQAALSTIPATLTAASAGFAAFTAQSASASSRLIAINAPIAAFKAQIMSITPALVAGSAGFAAFASKAGAITTGLMMARAAISALVSALTGVTASTMLVSTGLAQIGASATMSASMLRQVGTAISQLGQQFATLPVAVSAAVSSMMTLSSQAMTTFIGLASVSAPISAFKAQIMSITPALLAAGASFALFSGQSRTITAGLLSGQVAIMALVASLSGLTAGLSAVGAQFQATGASAVAATNLIRQMASAGPVVASAMSAMASATQAALSQILGAARASGAAFVATMRGSGIQGGLAFASGIHAGQGPAVGAMSAIIAAVRATASSGAGAMQSVGAMIGQGLAAGMMSALGAVTAAANALVAQAEKAAQAKAKIHSPSHLFRDEVGNYIGLGMAEGMDRSSKAVVQASQNLVAASMPASPIPLPELELSKLGSLPKNVIPLSQFQVPRAPGLFKNDGDEDNKTSHWPDWPPLEGYHPPENIGDIYRGPIRPMVSQSSDGPIRPLPQSVTLSGEGQSSTVSHTSSSEQNSFSYNFNFGQSSIVIQATGDAEVDAEELFKEFNRIAEREYKKNLRTA